MAGHTKWSIVKAQKRGSFATSARGAERFLRHGISIHVRPLVPAHNNGQARARARRQPEVRGGSWLLKAERPHA